MRTALEKQAMRAEIDKKLLEERMERARLESLVKEKVAGLETRIRGQALREQVRALQSHPAIRQSQWQLSSLQPADLGERGTQPQRRPQAHEQPTLPPPQTEKRIQAVELQQPHVASSVVSDPVSSAPVAQTRSTDSQEELSTAIPPPAAVASLRPQPAEVQSTAPRHSAPEPLPQRKHNHAPTKSIAAAAVPVPGSFDSHFFIRFVGRAWHQCGCLALTPASAFVVCVCSHSQASGGDQANAIYLELERMGFTVSIS